MVDADGDDNATNIIMDQLSALVCYFLFSLSQNGGSLHNSGNNYPLRGSKATLWEGGTRGVAFVYSDNLLNQTGYVNSELVQYTLSLNWSPC